MLGVVFTDAVLGPEGLFGGVLVAAPTGDVAVAGLNEPSDVGGKTAGELSVSAPIPPVAGPGTEIRPPVGDGTGTIPLVQATVYPVNSTSERPVARRRMYSAFPDRFGIWSAFTMSSVGACHR